MVAVGCVTFPAAALVLVGKWDCLSKSNALTDRKRNAKGLNQELSVVEVVSCCTSTKSLMGQDDLTIKMDAICGVP